MTRLERALLSLRRAIGGRRFVVVAETTRPGCEKPKFRVEMNEVGTIEELLGMMGAAADQAVLKFMKELLPPRPDEPPPGGS